MSVTNLHPEYEYFDSLWQKMRDTTAGQEQVYKRGTTYLPMLGGQNDAEYEAYKKRALFLNATGRTVDSMIGLVYRKPPEIELPPAMEEWSEDITADGVSIEQLTRECLDELLTVTRYGIMVDFPEIGETDGPLTVADVEENGIRPRLKLYQAESIINWKTETIGNKDVLTLVVLQELELDATGEFDTSTYVTQYRVLDLTPKGYRQRVFNESGELTSGVMPRANGQAMNFIPFIIVGENGEDVDVSWPVLNDLADINLSHYMAYADYRHGLHFTGLPTAVVTGVSKEDLSGGLNIGSTEAWVFAQADASAFYLEFEGKGLDGLKEELENLEINMANFGAKLLREQKKGVESAETAEINRAGESSLLASYANVVAASVVHALEIARDWAGLAGDIMINLNTDFMPAKMDSSLLKELTAALVANKISYETYWQNLVAGEIGAEGKSADEEQELIELDGPQLMDGE